ncbi:MAG: class I SAM-dependent methyltransferase [Bacteroidales bacterium]
MQTRYIKPMRENVVPLHEKIEPIKMEESSIPLSDNLADVLIMINLHHELHDPGQILKECTRVLKPGGKQAIVDWKKKKTEHGPPGEKRYDAEAIHSQLASAHFHSVEVYNQMPDHFLMVAENLND